ncbi:hypothetical protein ASE04_21140 [Rhizobium sp. Root708]|uniref:hypothetical protein n=1 Tax=Rhizobium sp. Root708 TaxID=1736592 RepID=UPI000701C9DA|nr:hypothetical protein [Rhizobium sp. Root708]KRB61378.1 hypothetical protein ASE04_21140 [Rhizobium sp. Root708]
MPTRHDADPKALLAARRREVAKPGRHKATGRGSGLTASVRTAIEYLVFGKEGEPATILKLEDAASAAGITGRALRAAMLKPSVEQFYQQQVVSLRNGERAASIRTIAQIRDDEKLKATAAGQNVRLKAADTLAFDKPGTQVVNHTQINNVNVTPGYVIDLTPDTDDEARAAARQTRGISSTIDLTPEPVVVASSR